MKTHAPAALLHCLIDKKKKKLGHTSDLDDVGKQTFQPMTETRAPELSNVHLTEARTDCYTARFKTQPTMWGAYPEVKSTTIQNVGRSTPNYVTFQNTITLHSETSAGPLNYTSPSRIPSPCTPKRRKKSAELHVTLKNTVTLHSKTSEEVRRITSHLPEYHHLTAPTCLVVASSASQTKARLSDLTWNKTQSIKSRSCSATWAANSEIGRNVRQVPWITLQSLLGCDSVGYGTAIYSVFYPDADKG
jgi:hypothetical protein